jgi:phage terminase large subunit GpA-like protein
MPILLASAPRLAEGVLAEVLTPPPPVDYLAWAKTNISFTKRESPFPGPYNPDLFPYFSEILAALGPDDPCRLVTLSKSAQLGGTVIANIFTLGSIDMDPGDVLYIHPTEDNARRWSKMKLAPMLRSTTALQRIFTAKARDGADSVLYKERNDGRGALLISGANSPSSLSQVSMPRQVHDDLAKWEINAAGDPEVQADSRSRAYEFAKLLKISTPLVVPGCRITRSFEAGSQEYFYVPCPQCGHEQVLDWENLLANLDEADPDAVHFSCVECGFPIEDHHRPAMVRAGQWKAHNPKAQRDHRSFHLWSAYSLLQSLPRIAREWLKAKGDPAAEQVFENDTVGRAYRTLGEAPPWEELRKRADETGHKINTIPAGGLVVTMGIDCQKDFCAYQVIAWTRDGRRYVVTHGTVDGHISEDKARDALDRLVGTGYRNEAGQDIASDLTAIDGNAWTEDVWDWAKRHPTSSVIMVRGVADERAPLLARVKRERSRTGKVLRYSSRFYNFGTSILKMALYRNLVKADPIERGHVGFPKGLEDGYFKELTAETRKAIRRKDGFVTYQWVKDPNLANEMLDTMLQAEAAAIKFGVRSLPESRWDLIEAERSAPPAAPQLDLEDQLFRPSQPPPPPARQEETKRNRFAEMAARMNR